MSIVNSHNEWDQLEEVIVGDGFPENIPALDFSFKLFSLAHCFNSSNVPAFTFNPFC